MVDADVKEEPAEWVVYCRGVSHSEEKKLMLLIRISQEWEQDMFQGRWPRPLGQLLWGFLF